MQKEIIIKITLVDLPEEQRKELAEDIGVNERDLANVTHIEASEFVDLLQDPLNDEMFHGSDMFCLIESIELVPAEDPRQLRLISVDEMFDDGLKTQPMGRIEQAEPEKVVFNKPFNPARPPRLTPGKSYTVHERERHGILITDDNGDDIWASDEMFTP